MRNGTRRGGTHHDGVEIGHAASPRRPVCVYHQYLGPRRVQLGVWGFEREGKSVRRRVSQRRVECTGSSGILVLMARFESEPMAEGINLPGEHASEFDTAGKSAKMPGGNDGRGAYWECVDEREKWQRVACSGHAISGDRWNSRAVALPGGERANHRNIG